MADYAIGRTGGSLRDALNQLYPMTGLGEYGAMFPPPTGADQPSGPIPLPQVPPPGAMGLPPPQPGQAPPGLQRAPGLGGGLPPGLAQAQLAGGLQNPQLSGGLNVPLGPNVNATAAGSANPMFAGGRMVPGGNYAARLGLAGNF
jgi:hypothetical protein